MEVFFCGILVKDIYSNEDSKQTISVIGYKKSDGGSQKVPIDMHSPLKTSLRDILSKEAGIQILQYGAPGGFSSIRIRASSSNQTDLYIDGIKMNDLYSGSFNAENFSPMMFQNMEIYRTYPKHLGDLNTGGAINMIPRKGIDSGYGIAYRIFGDSLMSLGSDLLYSTQNAIQFLHISGSKNRYTVLDDNGTPFFNKKDDYETTRKNEDYTKMEYSGYYRTNNPLNQWKFLWNVFYKESGIPGPSGDLLQMRLEESRFYTIIQNEKILSSRFFLISKASIIQTNSHTSDPEQNIYVNQNEEKRMGLSFLGKETLGFIYHSHKLKQSITFRKDHLAFDSSFFEYNTIMNQYSDRNHVIWNQNYAYTSDQFPVHFFSGYTIQNTYESSNLSQNNSTSNLTLYGGNGQVHLYPIGFHSDRQIYFFSGIDYSQRIPSFSEKFGNGAFVLSNEELKNEYSTQYSIGLNGGIESIHSKVIQRIKLRTELFTKEIDNFILFIPNSQNTIRAINTETSEITGIENSFKAGFLKYWLLYLNFTWMRAIDKSSLPAYHGKYLPQIPRYYFSSFIEYQKNRWIFQIHYQFYGATFRDRYNSAYYYIASKNILDLSITRKIFPSKNHSLSFSIRNLLNEQKKDFLGYPIPGRYYSISFSGSI